MTSTMNYRLCQCPLGLIPHFYMEEEKRLSNEETVSMPSRAYASFLQGVLRIWPDTMEVSMPSRAYASFLRVAIDSFMTESTLRVNALSGLCLISTVPLQKPRFYAVSRACFCRYLSEYSDNSYFSCMLTFWTYLMRCTYP